MIGRKFNRLTVIDRDGANRQGKPMWLCRCDCGNMTTVSDGSLKTGSTKSCGCLNSPDITGCRFGNLVVIGRSGSKHGGSAWECRCVCGSVIRVDAKSLRNGNTKSCGCLRYARWQNDRPKSEQRKERQRASVRRHMARRYADPMIRMHMLIAGRLRKSLQSIGKRKIARTFEMLGYSSDDLKQHIERQFTGGMAWENMGQWHIDHIVPISTAETQEDVVRLNQLPNLRPLWASDNLSKGSKRQFLV